ncbi:MAG: AraC family transcriptional regulator, partial [Paenibacillaceae bacterium]|nr:AraC family transcriptional regulator [Paenibacillaceae bacterium]
MTHIPLVCSQYRKRDPDFPFQLAVHRLDKHFPAHRHDFMEFSLVLEGSGTEVIDGVEHRMECGTFTFVMPYQVHEIFVNPEDGKPLKLFNCNFGMELFWRMHDNFWINRFLLQADQGLPSQIQLEGGHYDRILATLTEMHEEYTRESLW